jgi:hypothetical protein
MSFLQELDVSISQGSAESRERALWYATDLLIVGRYTEDEIWMFGEIIGKLDQCQVEKQEPPAGDLEEKVALRRSD